MRSKARLEKVLRRIARDLDEIGARFALIGGRTPEVEPSTDNLPYDGGLSG